jgi:hypothetical protein
VRCSTERPAPHDPEVVAASREEGVRNGSTKPLGLSGARPPRLVGFRADARRRRLRRACRLRRRCKGVPTTTDIHAAWPSRTRRPRGQEGPGGRRATLRTPSRTGTGAPHIGARRRPPPMLGRFQLRQPFDRVPSPLGGQRRQRSRSAWRHTPACGGSESSRCWWMRGQPSTAVMANRDGAAEGLALAEQKHPGRVCGE